eukprot:m.220925 g.220925  ORF g.220925 m.220925 type:complete len:81 (+) comp33332_c0_seq9:1478-1720(+)
MEMCGLCPSSSVGGFLIILLSIFTSEYLSEPPLSAATNGEWSNVTQCKMIANDMATHLAQPNMLTNESSKKKLSQWFEIG